MDIDYYKKYLKYKKKYVNLKLHYNQNIILGGTNSNNDGNISNNDGNITNITKKRKKKKISIDIDIPKYKEKYNNLKTIYKDEYNNWYHETRFNSQIFRCNGMNLKDYNNIIKNKIKTQSLSPKDGGCDVDLINKKKTEINNTFYLTTIPKFLEEIFTEIKVVTILNDEQIAELNSFFDLVKNETPRNYKTNNNNADNIKNKIDKMKLIIENKKIIENKIIENKKINENKIIENIKNKIFNK